jgi:hypothetical protein
MTQIYGQKKREKGGARGESTRSEGEKGKRGRERKKINKESWRKRTKKYFKMRVNDN